MKLKRGINKNRGYCGYHNTWENKRVFLRSKLEFIYAKYLDNQKISYELEKKIYNINGRTYKPDFFITHSDGTLEIVEIKCNEKDAKNYLNLFADFFEKKNITYSVEYKFNNIVKDLNLKNEIEAFIQKYLNNGNVGYSGAENPRYGVKLSDDTKKKISDKMLEINQNEEFKKHHREQVLKSITRPDVIENRKLYNEKRKIKNKQNNPEIEFKCLRCKKLFIKQIKNQQKFCSQICAALYNIENKKFSTKGFNKTEETKIKEIKIRLLNNYRNSLMFMNAIKKIHNEKELEELISQSYDAGEIKKNQPYKIQTILKYFCDISNFIKELNVKN